jgi:hypothetical protein
MLGLALALVLDCKPVEFKPLTLEKKGLVLTVGEQSMTLTKGKATLWEHPHGGYFKVLFADDASWVAMRGPYGIDPVFIVSTNANAKGATVDPMEHLRADEKARVPETSCGRMWLQDWKSHRRGLELTIAQGEKPAVKLYVSPAGAVSR